MGEDCGPDRNICFVIEQVCRHSLSKQLETLFTSMSPEIRITPFMGLCWSTQPAMVNPVHLSP